jgi:ribose/xylose/arabinose/galactoside ABC-type transport system permease subunit
MGNEVMDVNAEKNIRMKYFRRSPEDYKSDRSDKLRNFIKQIYIYIVLIAIVLFLSVVKLDQVDWFERGHFLNSLSIINLFRAAVPIMILSPAFTLVMISGNIDLSVGSAMSLSAVVYAWLVLNGFGFIPAVLLTLVLGIVLGTINGHLVMKLRITPVIATLVTLNLFKGIALLIVPDGLSSIRGSADQVMPVWINDFARKDVLWGLPAAFYVAILVIILMIVVQRYAILGKYAAAIGGNRVAADLSGINSVKIVWILYIIVGFFAALAGIARASYMSMGDPLSGDGMELNVIIAVLLGGTAFSGGEGSVVKSVIGAFIIMCVTIGLMTVIPAYWQNVAKASVLIIAVVLNHLLIEKSARD